MLPHLFIFSNKKYLCRTLVHLTMFDVLKAWKFIFTKTSALIPVSLLGRKEYFMKKEVCLGVCANVSGVKIANGRKHLSLLHRNASQFFLLYALGC